MSEWQPIETAPKDGKDILLTDGKSVTTASWCNGEQSWEYNEREPCWVFYRCEDDYYSVYFNNDWATHWMPLPAPRPKAD